MNVKKERINNICSIKHFRTHYNFIYPHLLKKAANGNSLPEKKYYRFYYTTSEGVRK